MTKKQFKISLVILGIMAFINYIALPVVFDAQRTQDAYDNGEYGDVH